MSRVSGVGVSGVSGVSAAQLEGTLALVTGQELETPGEMLYVARREQPSLVATLLSAWEGEGRRLGPGLAHELAQHRGRMAFYRQQQARLPVAVVSLKGLEIADRYPDPLLRYMNDLDFWVPQRERLWELAAWLLDDGWSMHTATFIRLEREPEVILSLRRRPDDPYGLPYGIELSTLAYLGDGLGAPHRTSVPGDPVVKNLVALLYERFEQPYRARDLIDVAVLLGAASPGTLRACALAVSELALWPEYAELAALLAAGPLEVPELPGERRALVRASRLRRRTTVVKALRRPVSLAATVLQSRMTGAAVLDRLSPKAALEAGLTLFALPVEGGVRTDRLTIGESGGALWAHTPVGRFILVHGDEVDEELLGGAKAAGAL
ncbi:nucleotidyltransferase family protein [Nonomuraea sp. NPDC003754]